MGGQRNDLHRQRQLLACGGLPHRDPRPHHHQQHEQRDLGERLRQLHPVNGTTYSASGIYSHVAGCVTEVLDLNITPSSTNTTTASACDSYTWAVNGTTYTASGIYSHTVGCHTETLDLTITPSTSNSTSAIGLRQLRVAGQRQRPTPPRGTYTNVVGCHTETLVLTITQRAPASAPPHAACDSYTWAVNGTTYTASGNYTHTVGCHTETLDLTITQRARATATTASACDSYVWAVDGNTYSSSRQLHATWSVAIPRPSCSPSRNEHEQQHDGGQRLRQLHLGGQRDHLQRERHLLTHRRLPYRDPRPHHHQQHEQRDLGERLATATCGRSTERPTPPAATTRTPSAAIPRPSTLTITQRARATAPPHRLATATPVAGQRNHLQRERHLLTHRRLPHRDARPDDHAEYQQQRPRPSPATATPGRSTERPTPPAATTRTPSAATPRPSTLTITPSTSNSTTAIGLRQLHLGGERNDLHRQRQLHAHRRLPHRDARPDDHAEHQQQRRRPAPATATHGRRTGPPTAPAATTRTPWAAIPRRST
jgi:hypothetical protein